MRLLMALLGILLLGGVAALSTVVVDAGEHVVVTRFGKPTGVYTEPGLRLKWPTPIEQAVRLDSRRLFLATKDAEFLTADKKNVVIAAFATWRIVDPLRFLSVLRNRDAAEARLSAQIVSALGSAVGEAPFSAFVSDTGLAYARQTRSENPAPARGAESEESKLGRLEAAVLAATSEAARADFGIEIGQVGITRFIFPEQNLDSVFARMRAERQRIAEGFRAEGESEAQQIIAEAELKRAEITTAAEADAARVLGEAEAEAARIYAEAYRGREELYSFLRTLEAYEAILDEDTTILMPGDSPLFDLLLRFQPEKAAPRGLPLPGDGLALQELKKMPAQEPDLKPALEPILEPTR